MANIIAGRFDTQAQADNAIAALAAAGIPSADCTSFFLSPPGQHDLQPLGGDVPHSEGTKHAGKSATTAAALGGVAGLALGAATGAALGEPGFTAAGAIAGTGIGGYVGSLAGGLTGSRGSDPDEATRQEPVERAAGIMVAVRVDDGEEQALQVLRAQGAHDIERARGEWRDGWQDFDAARPPELVDSSAAPRGPAGPAG
jgi:hypothetical protein